ncbi:MAG: hypothetical protein ACJA1L_001810, partial [Paracoccaceae bacterium]
MTEATPVAPAPAPAPAPSPAIAASLPAVAAIVGACTIWGLSALYFSQ